MQQGIGAPWKNSGVRRPLKVRALMSTPVVAPWPSASSRAGEWLDLHRVQKSAPHIRQPLF
jgi:hypothetical protein